MIPVSARRTYDETDGEHFRVTVTLATGISEGVTRSVNLDYLDPVILIGIIPRLTVTDTNGNTCSGTVAINVTATFALWQQSKFTAAELASAALSGPDADPDQDGIVNLLEYAFGLEPKSPDSRVASRPRSRSGRSGASR